jgi:hypothetical protein
MEFSGKIIPVRLRLPIKYIPDYKCRDRLGQVVPKPYLSLLALPNKSTALLTNNEATDRHAHAIKTVRLCW